jgi:bacterioferritin
MKNLRRSEHMDKAANSTDLMNLLNKALAREIQVSIQYMLQHSLWTAHTPDKSKEIASDKQKKFLGTHFPFGLPGFSMRNIAITEMKHAEAIAERIVRLDGEPTTKPDPITIGNTAKEILEIDREAERGAIQLYNRIIDVAKKEDDEITLKLFKRILSDEEIHHRTFSNMLEGK